MATCAVPECACSNTAELCGGSCIDVFDDPANCGGCDHDCAGSQCVDGRCLPQTLAVAPNPPAEIALDGDDLVFATGGEATSSGAVYRVARAGGALQTLYRGLGAQPALAVADRAILVADSGQADGCKAQDSAGAIVSITDGGAALLSMGRRCARWLIPFDGGVLWVENAPLTHFRTGDPRPFVAQLSSKAAPDAPPIVRYEHSPYGIADLVRSGATLMWRQSDIDSVSVVQMPIDGGVPQAIVTVPYDQGTYGRGQLLAFAADADTLAYGRHLPSSFYAQAVLRSLATGEERTVDKIDGGVQRIAFDASFVYWISDSNVWAAELASGNRQQLSDDGTARELAQDDRFLYVLGVGERSPRQSKLSRIRKPAHITAKMPSTFRTCHAPFTECEVEPFLDAVCVDTAQDAMHCGDCMTACALPDTCVGGSCTCAAPSLVCGEDCIDPETDAAHCGRCGRSCGGGTCVGGDCTSVKIAPFAQAAVQDAAALYYGVGHFVQRLDKVSGSVATLGEFAYPGALAIDSARIYVVETSGLIGGSNAGTIHALAKDGSRSTPLYPGRAAPRQIAVAGNQVVWVEDAGPDTMNPATLVHAAADGSALRGSFHAVGLYAGASDDESRDVAVAGSVVYWLLGDAEQSAGAIVRVDLSEASPAPVLVTTLDRDPAALAIANGHIYVTTRGRTGAVLSLPAAGGPIDTLATGLDDAGRIEATADGNVYWFDGEFDTRVIHQLVPGAASRILARTEATTSATLLFDGDRLYTASYEGIFVLVR